MKTQFVPLSQARWLGRGLLAYVAKALAKHPPHSHPRASQGAGWRGQGGTLYSKWEHGPLPVLLLPSHPVGI